MVVGVAMRRSHVEIVLAVGLAALPRQRKRRPAGVYAALGPYFLARSKRASFRSQSFPSSLFAHASSTGPGMSTVWSGVSLADAGATVRSARERSGTRPLSRL